MKKYLNDGYLCQYRAGYSPVHRMGAGWKMFLTVILSAAAFTARDFGLLAGLAAVNGGYYCLARLKWQDFWRDVRLFLMQAVIIVLLYILRDGITAGFWPGTKTAAQILLFFLPGAVFLRTTSSSSIMRSLQKILSRRVAFFAFTSFRFIPFFARELHDIAQAQRLRGAKLGTRYLANPGNWSDIFHCLMVPLIIRALKTANDAALSAEARGFGRMILNP